MMGRRRLRDRHPAAGRDDAQRRLNEARLLRRQVEADAARNARLAAEATRLGKRNRIAQIVYYGLISGGK